MRSKPFSQTRDPARSAAIERSAKWIADLDEVERMTPDELRAECRRIAKEGGFLGPIADLALAEDAERGR